MTSSHDCHISCQVKTPNSTSARIYGWMTHVLCSLFQKQLLQPPKVSCNRKFTSAVALCLIVSHPHTSLPCSLVTCSSSLPNYSSTSEQTKFQTSLCNIISPCISSSSNVLYLSCVKSKFTLSIPYLVSVPAGSSDLSLLITQPLSPLLHLAWKQLHLGPFPLVTTSDHSCFP